MMAEMAWLYRRDRTTWLFKADMLYGGKLVHITRAGNVYAIFAGHEFGKPFWIGRLHGKSWLTAENELRATEIEFENGGRYMFPTWGD